MTRLDHSFHPGTAPTDPARPPVLLLHPWFGCHQMWARLAERLDAPSYAVNWYSLANGLDKEGWAASASPHGLARAALSLLDELGLEQVDVIGNSVGGVVSQILAAEHPERVRRLVLIGTGAALSGPPTAFGALVGRWIEQPHEREDLAGLLVDALVAIPFSPADREDYVGAVRAADAEFLAAVLTAARCTDLRPVLSSIRASTLVLRGEHDAARTRDHVAELVAALPDARAVELAGRGHSPMVEDPALTASLILEHLRAR
ncbi:alpha/beta fold hydrolase [Nocardioides alcanivorans]|uniref:alpha/beta fold hydrolase n=1 Tax=Nocardioides alcanivorans TaxID=2897352 RepID=UPI001F431EB9|nr:alpha/beta hydrolase [Nocardioides alcanivorans]